MIYPDYRLSLVKSSVRLPASEPMDLSGYNCKGRVFQEKNTKMQVTILKSYEMYPVSSE